MDAKRERSTITNLSCWHRSMAQSFRTFSGRAALSGCAGAAPCEKYRSDSVNETDNATLSKVPAVTLAFWIMKIAATTLGETGGDSVTMTLNWGYLVGTVIFVSLLLILVAGQIAARKFHPFLYWATIVASTTFGTTMADFADRSLGIGYTGGSTLLFVCLMIVLGLWYRSQGTIR